MYAVSLKQISIKYTKKEMFSEVVWEKMHTENEENNWILKLKKTLQSEVEMCDCI